MARKRPREAISNDSNDVAGIFAMMIAYLKLVEKEAREDRKTARSAEKRALEVQVEKLALETAKIDQMMDEAKKMADRVRQAALTAILSGEVSAGGAFTVTLPRSGRMRQKSLQLQRQINQIELVAEKADERAKAARSDADESLAR